MRKQINGNVEYEGIEYEYTAEIYTGEDERCYPDRITQLDRAEGGPLDEETWEDVEFIALMNAYLLEWAEQEEFQVKETGNGCSALVQIKNGTTCYIIRADRPSAPQTLGDPIKIGHYDQNQRLIGKVLILKGGITEWRTGPEARTDCPYADTIREIAKKQGRPNINPRWVEAYMRLEHSTLNHLSPDEFARQVRIAIACVDVVGPERAEALARTI